MRGVIVYIHQFSLRQWLLSFAVRDRGFVALSSGHQRLQPDLERAHGHAPGERQCCVCGLLRSESSLAGCKRPSDGRRLEGVPQLPHTLLGLQRQPLYCKHRLLHGCLVHCDFLDHGRRHNDTRWWRLWHGLGPLRLRHSRGSGTFQRTRGGRAEKKSRATPSSETILPLRIFKER